MNTDKLFYGDLMVCTKHEEVPSLVVEDPFVCSMVGRIKKEEKLYEENVLLVKTKNGYYVPVDGLSIADIAYLYLENKKRIERGTKASKMFFKTFPSVVGDIFVDPDSLVPYSKTTGHVSISKLQAEKQKYINLNRK